MRIEPLKMVPAVGSITSQEKAAGPSAVGGKNFGQILSDAMGDVNELQQKSEKASMDLASGKIQDVSEVVIASEKAAVALQLTMQVRNKVMDAYQEVMRMQV